MSDPERISSSRSSQTARVANPLATVSIFLTLCEITTGVAATQTSGAIQVVFTVFSVTFPLVIATGLFALLWQKPEVLYAPNDYSAGTSIEEFVTAVRKPASMLRIDGDGHALEKLVATAVESTIVRYRENPHADSGVDAQLLAHEVASKQIRTSTVEVQLPVASEEHGGSLVLRFGEEAPVDEVLDSVYFALAGLVPAYTYRRTWAIYHEPEPHPLKALETDRGISGTARFVDDRTLREIGVLAGSTLTVRLLDVNSRATPGLSGRVVQI